MSLLDKFLTHPVLMQLRRNHALEHAVLNILHPKNPKRLLAGYSDPRGLWIFGDVSTDELSAALEEAQIRLRAGESELAISPNCGTNFVASGVASGAIAWLLTATAGSGFRRKLERLPLVVAMSTLLLILTRPLGPLLQTRLTTCADLGNLEVSEIRLYPNAERTTHLIKTADRR